MYYKLVALNMVTEIGRSSWTLHLPSTIGRNPDHEVSINHESISRTHCRLLLNAAGALTVRDLGSMNGIYLDDKKISRSVLVPGDVLQVGAVSFRVEYDSDTSDTDHGTPEEKPQTYDLSSTVPMKVIPPPAKPAGKWWPS